MQIDTVRYVDTYIEKMFIPTMVHTMLNLDQKAIKFVTYFYNIYNSSKIRFIREMMYPNCFS